MGSGSGSGPSNGPIDAPKKSDDPSRTAAAFWTELMHRELHYTELRRFLISCDIEGDCDPALRLDIDAAILNGEIHIRARGSDNNDGLFLVSLPELLEILCPRTAPEWSSLFYALWTHMAVGNTHWGRHRDGCHHQRSESLHVRWVRPRVMNRLPVEMEQVLGFLHQSSASAKCNCAEMTYRWVVVYRAALEDSDRRSKGGSRGWVRPLPKRTFCLEEAHR